jgi:PAS domain S-box-containing protein
VTRPLALATSFAIFLGVLSAGVALVTQGRRNLVAEQRAAALGVATGAGEALEHGLSTSLAAAHALAAAARKSDSVDDFDDAAAETLRVYPGAGTLQLLPGGIVTRSYPAAGNERALGLDVLHDPLRSPRARAAIEARQATLDGPFTLVQGGLGFVLRMPVFRRRDGAERFWGLVAATRRFDDLLGDARIGELERAGYAWSISAAEGAPFAASSPAPRDPVRFDCEIPNGRWTLAIAPRGGWLPARPSALQFALAAAVAIIIATLAYRTLRQPEVLRREVADRTRALERASEAVRTSERELRTALDERVRAEERIREAHLALTALLDASPLAVLKLDAAANVTAWNAVAERIFGWTAAEVIGRRTPIVPPEAEPELQALLRTVFERGATATGLARQRRRKDGRTIDLHISVAPVKDASGAVRELVAYHVDMTEYRALEEALRQSQKMEAVGQLAGGVAHDFNNLLTIMNMHLELLEEQLGGVEPALSDLREVKRASTRAAGLTRQLLAFSRRQVMQPRVLDVTEVLGDMLKMLRRLIGEDVDLRVQTAGATWNVRADPGQLEQVVMNLAVNSRDAMPAGGALTIAIRNVVLDDAYARAHVGAAAGEHVLIEVADTGVGMDEATRARAFEPFFTTKSRDKGTGLGLSMAYGIVKQSGGHIELQSAPGQGTVVRVYLPRCDDAGEQPATAAAPSARLRGRERILLVEDDDAVRGAAARMLRGFGYTVREACDGAAALRMLEAEGRFDLLVSDVVMPGMSGGELVEQLRQAGHDPAILLVSGYTEDAFVRRGALPRGARFMPKPFTAAALAENVREVLAERPRAS